MNALVGTLFEQPIVSTFMCDMIAPVDACTRPYVMK